MNSLGQSQRVDPTFNPSGVGANGTIYRAIIQADKKIMIVGGFTEYNGINRNRIARLNENGTLDTSFDPGKAADGIVYDVIKLSDGGYIIAGSFFNFNGTSRNHIVKLTESGTVDNLFDPGTGADNTIARILLQADNKIIIAGAFSAYNGTSRKRIARLTTSGSLDVTFNPGLGANDNVLAVAHDADSKFIIGGLFTEFNGTSKKRIARLNNDGSLDNTFNSGTGVDGGLVDNISKLPNGQTIISGNFIDYNNAIVPKIAKINADGTKDDTFSTGSGPNSRVYEHAILPDGRIIISGEFNGINGLTRNGIAVLNANGENINPLTPSTGPDNVINSIAIIGNGNKVIIAGYFTSFEGTTQGHISRIVVTKQDQTITFNAIPDKLTTDAPFTLSPSSTSNLSVAISSPSPHISINNNEVSIIDPGSATIHTDQAGDISFNAAPRVSNTFCIDPVKPVITKIGNRELQSDAPLGNYWFLDGEQISNVSSKTLTATASGVYTVQVNIEGCKSEFSEAEALVVTGEDEEIMLRNVTLFPNPVNEQLNIDLTGIAAGKSVKIILTDAMGRSISETTANGGQIIQQAASAYKKGVYFAKVSYKKSIHYLKFIKK